MGRLCLFVFVGWGRAGQEAPARRAFEVVSIRPHEGPLRIIDLSNSGSRFVAQGQTWLGLVMYAYALERYQIVPAANAPADNTFYDIAARSEGDGTPGKSEFREMVRTMLEERFAFKAHHEKREAPVYFLVVNKGGPKFRASPAGSEFHYFGGVKGANQTIAMTNGTMEHLVRAILNSFFVDRPVLDHTGLAGGYDINLDATPETRMDRNADDLSQISIFAALKDQLGLRLEPQRATIDMLVVDHIEKPSSN